ncbi:MAG TPA: ubiquinone/menaquinone biosynthesis methyltransferase [Gemmatimonadales bacterium]|nr:ubiquinone/menaquinone biosynthesis methyltransferase [Gemmatimonadales bacterium]
MTLAPPASPPPPLEKRRYVREMFSAIAPRYDLLNHLLSLNVDRSWRRRAVDRLGWERRATGTFLDACAGTLDLAIELAGRPGFRGRVVGVDFAAPMLRLGADKVGHGPVVPAAADALALPFPDGRFDGTTVGFGVRNLDDLDAGLRELWRVLKPGARLVILDFTTPPSRPLRSLYHFYFRRVLPLVGRAVSGHPTAYAYLPASVETFPAPAELMGRMVGAGFRDAGYELLTGGIAAIHWGAR